ncbi:MAG: fibronectin type III domain-containing protein [Ignavibacteria bacterium]
MKIIPENLSSAKGDLKGEINLQWDSVGNAVSYVIEFARLSHSKEIKWKIFDVISDSRYTVKNLKSNKDYFFRVASLNGDGQGELSKKVIKKAP